MMERWICLFCGLEKDYRPELEEVIEHMRACDKHPLFKEREMAKALYDALAAIVVDDLRPDFQDQEDIILRFPGNRDAWNHARDLLGQIGPL